MSGRMAMRKTQVAHQWSPEPPEWARRELRRHGVRSLRDTSSRGQARAAAHIRARSNSLICDKCKGQGLLHNGQQLQKCPMCEGSGTAQLTPARIPVWYNVPTQAIGALATVPFTLQINQNADFEWVFTMATWTSALLNVSLTDGSTGRAITQAQNTQNQSGVGVCPINLFAGPNAGSPFPLLEPYVLARATSVQFYFTDLSGATNTLNLVLQGFQLVPQNAMQQGSAGRIVGI